MYPQCPSLTRVLDGSRSCSNQSPGIYQYDSIAWFDESMYPSCGLQRDSKRRNTRLLDEAPEPDHADQNPPIPEGSDDDEPRHPPTTFHQRDRTRSVTTHLRSRERVVRVRRHRLRKISLNQGNLGVRGKYRFVKAMSTARHGIP